MRVYDESLDEASRMACNYHIRNFGAVGDGVNDDTKAFENAIHLVEKNGGGRLIVTGNGHYHIRPINLTSHFVLLIKKGATISAIADEKVWPIIPPLPSYGQGRDHPGPRYTSLLHGENLQNVTIQGEGMQSVIDGQGEYWWDLRRKGLDRFTRGHLFECMHCSKVHMYNLRLVNSPFWTNHFFDSEDIHVKNVTVEAPQTSLNTDGWDPDSSRNVVIEDSYYAGGDDCVAIKSGWDCFGLEYGKPSVNITIRNVSCDGRFAGIAVGSEMSGGIENVTIENVRFARANKPANIKVGNTRGGYVKNIVYRDVVVDGPIDQAVHVDFFHYYNSPNPSCPDDWKPPALPQVSDLYFERINGTQATIAGDETFHFAAYDKSQIRNVHMEDVYFSKPEHGVGWNCSCKATSGSNTNCTGVTGSVKNQTVMPWPPCHGFEIVDGGSRSCTFLLCSSARLWSMSMILVCLMACMYRRARHY